MKKNKQIIFLISILVFVGCGSNFKISNVYTQKLEKLERSMVSYMNNADPGYTQKDINKCLDILKDYLAKMANSNSKDEGLKTVKSAVLTLNKLNEKCDHQLIETGEREQIADIIISAAAGKGYTTMQDDITEEWREW